MAPKVSVVMSVYNGEPYLAEAIESILNQSFSDFQFIIVNDGSTDNTPAILESYTDTRIEVIHNQKNLGLTRSLNIGLSLVQGKYVARLDADDISIPCRFEKQVDFLEKHPDVGILGSSCRFIDTKGNDQGIFKPPQHDAQIRWKSLLANPFRHPTVMMRTDILRRYGLTYDETFEIAQDYDLWTRMLRYTFSANLCEPLVQYRLDAANLSGTRRKTQLQNHDKIALRTIQEQMPNFAITLEQVSQMRAIFVGGSGWISGSDIERIALFNLYLDLFESFIQLYPEEPCLTTVLHQETLKIFRLMLRVPFLVGWGRMVKRLITMDPGLPWIFFCHSLKGIGRRLSLENFEV